MGQSVRRKAKRDRQRRAAERRAARLMGLERDRNTARPAVAGRDATVRADGDAAHGVWAGIGAAPGGVGGRVWQEMAGPREIFETEAGGADGQMADGQMTDGQMADGQMADGQMTDGRRQMGDGRMADGKDADRKYANRQNAQGKREGGRMAVPGGTAGGQLRNGGGAMTGGRNGVARGAGMLDEAIGVLTAGATEAADALRGLLRSEDERVRIKAALGMFKYLLALREQNDVIERLARMERRAGLETSTERSVRRRVERLEEEANGPGQAVPVEPEVVRALAELQADPLITELEAAVAQGDVERVMGIHERLVERIERTHPALRERLLQTAGG